MQRTFGGCVRAALIGSGTSLILTAAVLAAPVLAADLPSTAAAADTRAIGPHTHQLHGTVKTAPSTGGTSFTLTTERYGDVTVSFSGTTPKGLGHGRGKARAHELASLGDLKVAERVVVQGRTSADGKSFVARRVHVLPAADGGERGAVHTVGSVAGVTATTLTVKLADGTSQSVAISAETKIRPQGK